MEQQQNQNLIRDGDVDDEPADAHVEDDEPAQQRAQFAEDGKSKLVQEAKAMMRDGDEDEGKPAGDENTGPKIKMGRIGKKKRTNAAAAARKDDDQPAAKRSAAAADDDVPTGGETFSDSDIEFMKRAIQLLC